MFKNLLLEEDSDDSFSTGQEDVDIQVSISDFDSPKVNVQQVSVKKVCIKKLQSTVASLEKQLTRCEDAIIYEGEKMRGMRDQLTQLRGTGLDSYSKMVEQNMQESNKILQDYQRVQNELTNEITQTKIQMTGDRFLVNEKVVQMFLGAIGASIFSNKLQAKSLSNQPSKCPTLKEVKRAAKQLKQAKDEYKSINNQTKSDFIVYKEKIKPLNQLKENYANCQRLQLYK